jgi:hypothetical protein
MTDQRAGQESISPRRKKGSAAHTEEAPSGTPFPLPARDTLQVVKAVENEPAHAPHWRPVLSESWSIDQMIQQVRGDKLFTLHDKEIATYLAYPTETAQYARDRLRAADSEAEQKTLDQLSIEDARGHFRGRIEDIER